MIKSVSSLAAGGNSRALVPVATGDSRESILRRVAPVRSSEASRGHDHAAFAQDGAQDGHFGPAVRLTRPPVAAGRSGPAYGQAPSPKGRLIDLTV